MTLSKTGKRIGGNRKSQTFRNCKECGKRFGPLPRLSRQFCSKKCAYAYRTGRPSAKRGRKYPHLQRARIGACEVCQREYRAIYDYEGRRQRFCSKRCYQIYWKKDVRPKMQKPVGLKGENNPEWKGDDAGYSAIHKWIARELGEPNKCEHCGRTDKKKYEWCNIDHQYRRELADWMRLCTSCHRIYDYKWLK